MTDPEACPACGSRDAATLAVRHTFLRHMDYAPMRSQPGQLLKCRACQMVYVGDQATIDESRAVHEGAEYASVKTSPYVVLAPDGAPQGTTYDAMADILCGALDLAGKRVLDFGCFEGKLLAALDRRTARLDCHGYDVSAAVAPLFPDRSNFTFWSGDRRAIPGKFDLITVVNALMYVEDVQDALRFLVSRLNCGGALFFIVPDCARNPHALLYGDQRTFYTPAILRNLAAQHGLGVEPIDTPAFPRSIVALCRAAGGAASAMSADDAPERGLAYLDTAKETLLRAVSGHRATHRGGKIGVLGVSPNAAWAGQVLNGSVDLYVDENPSRRGGTFCGRRVEHPSALGADDMIVLPYGPTARPIAERFAKAYSARLLPV